MYLVFFDVDDTLIKGQSQKYLIEYLFKKRLIKFHVFIRIYFWFFLYRIGLVKNSIYVAKKAYLMCKGWSQQYMNTVMDDFFNSVIKNKFYKKSLDLINYHKRSGAKIILISSSLYPIISRIKDFLNLDEVIATRLDLVNNIYNGLVNGCVVYGDNKIDLVNQFIKSNHFSLASSYAYSDHLSDIGLMRLVDNPVIVNPSKQLYQMSINYNWRVEYIK